MLSCKIIVLCEIIYRWLYYEWIPFCAMFRQSTIVCKIFVAFTEQNWRFYEIFLVQYEVALTDFDMLDTPTCQSSRGSNVGTVCAEALSYKYYI